MENLGAKRMIKKLYEDYFDSVLSFRRKQDKDISIFSNELIFKLENKKMLIEQVEKELKTFNQNLVIKLNSKLAEQEFTLVNIEYLKDMLDKKDLKEIKKHEKKITSSISKLMGANADLMKLKRRIKRARKGF